MDTTIHRGDLLAHMRGRLWLVENGYIPKAHAVLCDPPYFLGSIVKRFGGKDAKPAQYGKDGLFQRQSRGFMQATWDGFKDVWEYQAWCEEWGRLLLHFVHPGAVMLCFGGTRTYHRLAAGLEDAGWVVSDCIMWTYASGFPKSHSIGKAIDKAAGAEREVTGVKPRIYADNPKSGANNPRDTFKSWDIRTGETATITAPSTEAAKHWDGYGTSLAPSYEPILVCRAPWTGTYAGIAQEYGTGAINIEGSRIGLERRFNPATHSPSAYGGFEMCGADGTPALGRWPKNFILGCDCESDVHRADCPVTIIGAQSGESASNNRPNSIGNKMSPTTFFSGFPERVVSENPDDSGTAARFYFQAKSARWEREAGLHHRESQTVNDGRNTPIDNPYQRGETERLNSHPTLKPIKLTEYLATLLLPPELDTPRRLLVPFSGSGSEMIGARLAGWDDVVGFEQSADYVDIAQARLMWWAQFSNYDMAKRAYDADMGEQKVRDEQAAHGLRQHGLFEGVTT